MNHVSRLFSYLMVFAALVMAVWGTLGFIEYFTGHAVLVPLQNANFPSGTQFLHWLVISVAGFTLLIGYISTAKNVSSNKSLQRTFDPPRTFAVAKARVASNAAELKR